MVQDANDSAAEIDNGPKLGLVLSGGGARAAYQAGTLQALAEITAGDLQAPIVSGVSAGAINACHLACHPGPMKENALDLQEAWRKLTIEQVFRIESTFIASNAARWLWLLATGRYGGRIRIRGLLETQPLREFLSRQADFDQIGRNIESGRLRALAISATSYSNGLTFTFVQGVPGLADWRRYGRRSVQTRINVEHVMASAALPLIFPAIQIDGDFYGDGGIRQPAPLAPSIHLGADRLLAISIRYARTPEEETARQVVGYPPPAQVGGMLLNAIFLDSLETDSERLRRMNTTLELLPEGVKHPEGLRPIPLLMLRPSRDLGKMSAGLDIELPRPLRLLVRGLGANRSSSPDFLSYLLFERPYIERLMELGYHDALAQRDSVLRFLE